MSERAITYWKCIHCHGTGVLIVGIGADERLSECHHCDGTGNAIVTGAEERHRRRIAEIQHRNPLKPPA